MTNVYMYMCVRVCVRACVRVCAGKKETAVPAARSPGQRQRPAVLGAATLKGLGPWERLLLHCNCYFHVVVFFNVVNLFHFYRVRRVLRFLSPESVVH